MVTIKSANIVTHSPTIPYISKVSVIKRKVNNHPQNYIKVDVGGLILRLPIYFVMLKYSRQIHDQGDKPNRSFELLNDFFFVKSRITWSKQTKRPYLHLYGLKKVYLIKVNHISYSIGFHLKKTFFRKK